MINKENKNAVRAKRHLRVRNKVSGTAARPRLNVYRSSSNIYAQIIDDVAGNTLVSSSTIAKGVNVEGLSKTEAAVVVGKDVAAKALEKGNHRSRFRPRRIPLHGSRKGACGSRKRSRT